jgi:hypothetical protein
MDSQDNHKATFRLLSGEIIIENVYVSFAYSKIKYELEKLRLYTDYYTQYIKLIHEGNTIDWYSIIEYTNEIQKSKIKNIEFNIVICTRSIDDINFIMRYLDDDITIELESKVTISAIQIVMDILNYLQFPDNKILFTISTNNISDYHKNFVKNFWYCLDINNLIVSSMLENPNNSVVLNSIDAIIYNYYITQNKDNLQNKINFAGNSDIVVLLNLYSINLYRYIDDITINFSCKYIFVGLFSVLIQN